MGCDRRPMAMCNTLWRLPCHPLRGRVWMYLLYPKNPTWRWLRAIPTPLGPKNVHNFLLIMIVRPLTLSWACRHGTEMSLILKKLFLTWLLPDIFRYDSPKKCPTILYAVDLWLKSATGANCGGWRLLTTSAGLIVDLGLNNLYPAWLWTHIFSSVKRARADGQFRPQ